MQPPRAAVEVVIDTPRFSPVKRDDRGAIDFIYPLPCPFNYGSVPGTRGADGDRIDAIVLGPRLPRHARARMPVVAVARFVDDGAEDLKWICSSAPLSAGDRLQIAAFFALFVPCKRILNALRGRRGITRYEGLEACYPQAEELRS